jgi:hypothetical protein
LDAAIPVMQQAGRGPAMFQGHLDRGDHPAAWCWRTRSNWFSSPDGG